MAEKKQFWTTLRVNLSIISALIAGISVVVVFFVKAENTKKDNEVKHKDIENRIYPNVQTLQKAIDHDNEVPTDVENFIREQRLIEQGDKTIIQQVKIDSQQTELKKDLKVVDSFFTYIKKERQQDSVKNIAKDKSRDERTDEIQNIGNILRAMQRKLDTMN